MDVNNRNCPCNYGIKWFRRHFTRPKWQTIGTGILALRQRAVGVVLMGAAHAFMARTFGCSRAAVTNLIQTGQLPDRQPVTRQTGQLPDRQGSYQTDRAVTRKASYQTDRAVTRQTGQLPDRQGSYQKGQLPDRQAETRQTGQLPDRQGSYQTDRPRPDRPTVTTPHDEHLYFVTVRSGKSVRSWYAMGRRIDPSWWTHWAISRSSQCSTTGVRKAVVCVILSVGWWIYKNHCC